jgi:hypothetical protein
MRENQRGRRRKREGEEGEKGNRHAFCKVHDGSTKGPLVAIYREDLLSCQPTLVLSLSPCPPRHLHTRSRVAVFLSHIEVAENVREVFDVITHADALR